MESVLTLAEAARRLKLSERTVRKHIKAGALRASKPGRGYRITEDAVTAFLKASEVAS